MNYKIIKSQSNQQQLICYKTDSISLSGTLSIIIQSYYLPLHIVFIQDYTVLEQLCQFQITLQYGEFPIFQIITIIIVLVKYYRISSTVMINWSQQYLFQLHLSASYCRNFFYVTLFKLDTNIGTTTLLECCKQS